jgi:hypothetical protein
MTVAAGMMVVLMMLMVLVVQVIVRWLLSGIVRLGWVMLMMVVWMLLIVKTRIVIIFEFGIFDFTQMCGQIAVGSAILGAVAG